MFQSYIFALLCLSTRFGVVETERLLGSPGVLSGCPARLRAIICFATQPGSRAFHPSDSHAFQRARADFNDRTSNEPPNGKPSCAVCTILPSVWWFVPEADDLRQEARVREARHVNLKSSCDGLSFPIPANQPPFERVYCSFQNGFIVLGPFRPARLRAAYNKLTRVTQISSSVLTHALWSIWRWA